MPTPTQVQTPMCTHTTHYTIPPTLPYTCKPQENTWFIKTYYIPCNGLLFFPNEISYFVLLVKIKW